MDVIGLDDTETSGSNAKTTSTDDDSLFGGPDEAETTSKGKKAKQTTTSDDSWFGGGSDEATTTAKGRKGQAEETDVGGLEGMITALSPDDAEATGRSRTMTRGASSSDGAGQGEVKKQANAAIGAMGGVAGIIVCE